MKRFLTLLLVAMMLCAMTVPAMADAASNLSAFADMMDAKGYTYELNDDYMTSEFSIDCALEECKVWVFPYDMGIKVQADCTFDAPSRHMDELAKWIVMMNNSLRVGEFYMDFENGYIGYEVFCLDYTGVPSADTMNYALVIAVTMLESYGEGILAITESGYSAEEAYEMCMAE